MGMDTLHTLFEAASKAGLNTGEKTPHSLRECGDALLKLSKFALSEALDCFRAGLRLDPNDVALKTSLDEALHKGKGNKVDSLMEKMDSGLQRCMRLVEEIRSSAAKTHDLPSVVSRVQAIPAVNMLLITANTGSCFETPTIEEPFLELLQNQIKTPSPDIAIVHFQEMCGKEWKDRDTKTVAANFSAKLIASLADSYYSAGMMFHPASGPEDSSFTALASVVFVAKKLIDQDRVALWDFESKRTVSLASLAEQNTQLQGADLCRFFEHMSFPGAHFPEIKAGRKGFLHTRWIVDETPIDIVNMHLFHDMSNLETFRQQSPSVYAVCRKRAFQFMLDHCTFDHSNNVFVFGDFNFRLDLPRVVPHLLGENFTESEVGDKEKSIRLTNPATNASLVLGKKIFDTTQANEFTDRWSAIRQFDTEAADTPKSFNFAEMPVNFPPSYPYEEEPGHPTEYMRTRCPGWCDRVIFSSKTRSAISNSEYGFLGGELCIGDHKPVFLRFSWNPSSL